MPYQNTYTNEVMLFAGMRRGGRAIYAFNVSNPDQPRLMWRINNWFSGYGSIGQTWSMPRVSRVKGRTDPVLIMAGGYDPNAEDVTPAGTPTIGRGVYIMNIRTGEVLGWLPTDYSVPADATVIDSDGDGYVDRVTSSTCERSSTGSTSRTPQATRASRSRGPSPRSPR